jgi:hypothetical protein
MSQVVADLSWHPSNNGVQTSNETNGSQNLSSGFLHGPDSSSYYGANNENDLLHNNNAKSLFLQFQQQQQQKAFNGRQAMPTGGMVRLLLLNSVSSSLPFSESIHATPTTADSTTGRLGIQPEQLRIWTAATDDTEPAYATAP